MMCAGAPEFEFSWSILSPSLPAKPTFFRGVVFGVAAEDATLLFVGVPLTESPPRAFLGVPAPGLAAPS